MPATQLSQESLIYAINLVIGAILAALITQQWRREDGESRLGYWTGAAWTMTAADLLFAVRPLLPYAVGRLVPTVLVTVGHGLLLLGAWRTAERIPQRKIVVAVVLVHTVALGAFLLSGSASGWRTVMNGVVWGGLSVASCVWLRRAPQPVRRTMAIPAFVFAAHAGFHAFRLSLATIGTVQQGTGSAWLQVMGDVEVSFFMVALFVSLLAAHLQLRNLELRAALGDVQLLSGLLPICAWCRKVRSDDGYWDEIVTYFEKRQNIRFTHGICDDCHQAQLSGPPPTAPVA